MSLEITSTESTPEITADTTGSTSTETSTPQVINESVTSEPEFTPNYKYKAYGKELEVDEWARPLINKDNQEHIIKLHERAGGFDHLKNNFKDLEQKYSSTENNFKQLNNVRHTILNNIEKGDLGKAFGVIGLTDDQVFNYVKKKLEYQNLPADQRQIVDSYRANLERTEETQNLLAQQRAFAEDIMMQKHELEVMTTFSNPKYAPLINEYNTRLGDENAFRSVVQQVGATEFYTSGRHIPVSEATDRALKMLALNPSQAVQISQNASGDTSNVQTSHVQTQQQPAPKPIMRVGKGGGAAPISQRPRSIADLNKIYQSEYGVN